MVTLEFEYLTWDVNPSGSIAVNAVAIPSHICTDAELGIGTTSTMGFYPTETNSQTALEFYKAKFYCPDSTDIRIRGEFNAHKVKLLGVSLKYCTGSCTPDPAWFTGNFMVILHNQSWFDI